MATYKKKLKRAKDGCVVRYIGKSFGGQSEKFRLGFDLKEAEKREALILELWAHLEHGWNYMDGAFYWTKPYLSAAKAIAKGKPPLLPATFSHQSNPASYVESMNRLGAEFRPADPQLFDEGVSRISDEIRRQRKSLDVRGGVERTGQTLGQAITSFRESLRIEWLNPDGSIRPSGRTELTQLQTWERFLAKAVRLKSDRSDFLEVDLAEVSLTLCQEVIDVVRKRPVTFESQRRNKKNPKSPLTRLVPKSATSIIRLVIEFFDWLDRSEEFHWEEPPKFRKLNIKPVPLTSDEKFLRKEKKATFIVADEHIEILSKYSQPLERVFLLLGLNCAFGPGEIGQLRIPFIKEETQEIVGIRFKTGGDTRHHLWRETLEGLRWQLKERAKVHPMDQDEQQIVFLRDSGNPHWKTTKSGNYSDGVANVWSSLIKRIKKDHADFPSYSFGKLRKTAATHVLKIADAESASLILAHQTISEDELLKHYIQLPWEKLYDAQARYGERIAPLLKLDRPAFDPLPKMYIGLDKVEKIADLHRKGEKAAAIAKQLDVSISTVYRHIQKLR